MCVCVCVIANNTLFRSRTPHGLSVLHLCAISSSIPEQLFRQIEVHEKVVADLQRGKPFKTDRFLSPKHVSMLEVTLRREQEEIIAACKADLAKTLDELARQHAIELEQHKAAATAATEQAEALLKELEAVRKDLECVRESTDHISEDWTGQIAVITYVLSSVFACCFVMFCLFCLFVCFVCLFVCLCVCVFCLFVCCF